MNLSSSPPDDARSPGPHQRRPDLLLREVLEVLVAGEAQALVDQRLDVVGDLLEVVVGHRLGRSASMPSLSSAEPERVARLGEERDLVGRDGPEVGDLGRLRRCCCRSASSR